MYKKESKRVKNCNTVHEMYNDEKLYNFKKKTVYTAESCTIPNPVSNEKLGGLQFPFILSIFRFEVGFLLKNCKR